MSDAPRLFLITPPIADAAHFRPLLECALEAADVACVLLRVEPTDPANAKRIIRALAPLAQGRGAALLVEGDSRLAARTEADGVHVHGPGAELDEALAALRPRLIVGVDDIATRDDAMAAGEAGVDYLMFGAPGLGDPAVIVDWVGWWAGIFNVPCVGYARTPDDAVDIARAGAEFVALCEGLWDDPARVAGILGAVAQAIQQESAAT